MYQPIPVDVAASAAAFATTLVLLFGLSPLAPKLGLLDMPRGRKRHAQPTPLVGGLAIGLSVFAIWISGIAGERPPLGLTCAAALILVGGVLDDRFDLNWRVRLVVQAVAALLLILIDGTRVEVVGVVPFALGWLSFPVSVIAIIGAINALNMADGLDGLVGSLVAACFVMLIAVAAYAGNAALQLPLSLALGAVLGFLVLNLRAPWLRRARVFLGDAGSEFLGLIVAWAIFKLTQDPLHPVPPVLGLFLIAPPIIDCLAIVVRRLRAGQSPFRADRGHMHHLMLAAGVSTSGIVAIMVCVSLLLGLAAMLTMALGVDDYVLMAVFLGLTALYACMPRRARDVAIPGGLDPGKRGGTSQAPQGSRGAASAREALHLE